MPTDTCDVVAKPALAPAHECARCRSLDVVVVITVREPVATARCDACGHEGSLVPFGRAC